MDIQTTKIELAKLILDLENPSLLTKIKDLLTREASDFGTMLTKQEKFEIELGLKQVDNGVRIPFEKFMKRVSINKKQ